MHGIQVLLIVKVNVLACFLKTVSVDKIMGELLAIVSYLFRFIH